MENQTVNPKEVCSVRELSEYLGISESKLRRLVKQNTIPYAKIGGQYRFYLPKIRDVNG
ncbi:MAG TPA: helix-turn-helix domain-containing protein [Bacteroidota bacterium]|nr:helix-turn-helix domain-containing protein [Bacteroidota bacterium]